MVNKCSTLRQGNIGNYFKAISFSVICLAKMKCFQVEVYIGKAVLECSLVIIKIVFDLVNAT